MEQHITRYSEFVNNNGKYVGGTENIVTGIITGVTDHAGSLYNGIIETVIKFMSMVDRKFNQIVLTGAKSSQELFEIAYRALRAAKYETLSNERMIGFYSAFNAAMKSTVPAFYGGADCNCGENVMDYWTNSAYLVFRGGVETEKNVAFMIAGINTLIELINKSMKSKSSELNEPQVRELVKLYSDALEQLKKAVGDVNAELMKKNANLKKEFDTYAKLTPEELIKQLEHKVKNNAARAEFLNSIKLLAPTAYYANTLKDALAKLGLAVKDFEEANTDRKFNDLMNKIILKLESSDPNYVKKREALEILKKIHLAQPMKFEAAAEEDNEPEPEEEEESYSDYGKYLGGGGGESIFGGELLELDKKVDLLSKADKLYQSPLEISFKQENEKMLVELVQTAREASDEMYLKRSVTDDADIITFLTHFDKLRIVDLGNADFKNMFFEENNLFGIGYSRDAYLAGLDDIIAAGKKVESKVGPKFAAFVKYLESYRKFLFDSSSKLSNIVSKKGFNAKFHGGLHTQWSYTMADVVNTFVRGILVSQMRTGLEHSVKELESYNKDQSSMNAKIMGREINAMLKKANEILENVANHDNFPIPQELTKIIIQENLDGFIQLQRASQALNEKCKTYQMYLVKNPTKSREITELLQKVAIDINSIGDDTFKHLTNFLEFFHVESIAHNDNRYKDINHFNVSNGLNKNPTPILSADTLALAAAGGGVDDGNKHKLDMYDNDYLGKKYDQPTPYPIKIHDVLASHVPTMICASTDKKFVKRSSIGDGNINAYGGKRVLPSKASIEFSNTNGGVTIAGDGAVVVTANAVVGGFAHVGEYAITGTIAGPSRLPKKVKFIDKNTIIENYNKATEDLNKGVRQITSLKNLFSVFQSIDKSYQNEKSTSDSGMKIGEIYECFINYIIKTTRYPVLYKVKINNVDKYVCSHIALRKFGYDPIIPCDVKTEFRTTRNDMFQFLDKLSLREYFDGADYGNLLDNRFNNDASPFPKPSEIQNYINKNSIKLDKTYISNNVTLSSMFSECDNLCVMSLKSVVCKIFTTLSLFNVINLKDLATNLPFNQLRAIYGGLDLSHTITPNVSIDNTELYVRLYLLIVFYKGLFFEEAYGVGQKHIIAGAKRMAVLPGGSGVFDELLRFMFLRKFNERLANEMVSPTKTMDVLSFGIFIDICNKIAEKYKGATLTHIQNITLDLVDEINRRYGIVSTDQIKTLMQKENKREYPGISKLNIPVGQQLTQKLDRVPPTLLDGEGGSFRDTKVDSDSIQFGETSIGRVLTLINPDTDKFNMSEILSVVYNFRKKLDEMTETMTTEMNRRSDASGSDIYKNNNISNKCRVIRRHLADYSDNKGKLEYLKRFISEMGQTVVYNVNNDEIVYKELVLTPCGILNKLYNRLIAMSNLYGKQTYNNILNLNTHLYDLNSINTDLVTVVKTSGMPKLDFSVLAKTCDEYMAQIIIYHKQFVPALINTDGILDHTINMLINQHNYIWHRDGPLSDNIMKYETVVYVPLNDYSEFPNVLYNAGTEGVIGTNSWTAYRGNDIYDDPVTISDPRNKTVRNTRPGRAGEFPVLRMQLLSQRFSPKNIYQLFEYTLICMYRVFYENTGVVYQPLFSDFVNKLSSVIDFQNVIINDNESELGGGHAFQKGLPFSNKIASVYKLMYTNAGKNVNTIQPDITLLPSESIQAMKDYLGLFIFIFKYIITHAYIHSQILAINRYSGGTGSATIPNDAAHYTQGTAGTHELFPVIPPGGAAAADYIAYYEKLIRAGNAGGLGMRIYAGFEPNMTLTKYPKLQDLKTLGVETMTIDAKVNNNLTAAQNIGVGGFQNLSFNSTVTTDFAAGKQHSNFVFLNKYQSNDASQLMDLNTFEANVKNDLTALKAAIDTDNTALIKNSLENYYDKGINQNYLKLEAAKPISNKSAKGIALDKAYYDVFDNDFFNKISTFCKKYIYDVINADGFLYASGTSKDTIFSNFIKGVIPTEQVYERFNLISEFGITLSHGGEMIFPSRNFHCNSYMECADAAQILNMAKSLRKKITTGLSDPINIVASTLHGAAANAPINAIAGIGGADNFGAAGNYVVFADSNCTKPASGEAGLAGRKIYVKINTTLGNNFYGLRMDNHGALVALGPNVVRDKCANACTFAGKLVTLGDASQLMAATLRNVIEFIDGICTSRSRYDVPYLLAGDKDIVEVIGLIPDALLMFNKYIKLNNTSMTFEEYLPNFIMERIDLLLGKDYEAMIDIFGVLNPTIYATAHRRVARRAGGGILVRDRPGNLNAGTTTTLAGFTGGGAGAITRDIFSRVFGQTINGVHYLPHANFNPVGNAAADADIDDMDINEAPGSFQICINGIHKQSNIYNQFKYTDCNPFYDALLAASPLKIFADDVAPGVTVNSVTRVSSDPASRITVVQPANTQFYNCANNKNILAAAAIPDSEEPFTVITDDIITTPGSDKSHDRSMNGLTRVQSSAYDGVIPDNSSMHRSKYLPVIYEYIFKHIVCSASDKKFEDRYNKFKKKILDTFMKSYTPYESSDAFTAGIAKNKTYSYVPVAARASPRSFILGGVGLLHNHYIHNIIHPDMQNIFRLNLLQPPAAAEIRYIGNKQNSNTEGIYNGARRDKVGTDAANAAGGAYLNMAAVTGGGNAGHIAAANRAIAAEDAHYNNMFNIEKNDFEILPDSLLIENGNFARGILVDTDSDVAIKNKYLGLINRIPTQIMAEIASTSAQFIVGNAGGAKRYNIQRHIRCALSLSTDLFKQAMLALYKIMIYAYALGIFKGCLPVNGVTNLDILNVMAMPAVAPAADNPPTLLHTAGVITDEVRKAIRLYNALIAINGIKDNRLNGFTIADMVEYVPSIYFRTMTPNPIPADLIFTEGDLWANNDYIEKFGALVDSIYFAGGGAANDIGTTIFAVDYSAGAAVIGNNSIAAHPGTGANVIALGTKFDTYGFEMLFGDMTADATAKVARSGYDFPLPVTGNNLLANAIAVPLPVVLVNKNALPGVGAVAALSFPDSTFASAGEVYDFGGGANGTDHLVTIMLAKLLVVSLFSNQANPNALKIFPANFATTVRNINNRMNAVLYNCRSLIFGYLNNIQRICTNPNPEYMMFSYRHINTSVKNRISNTFGTIKNVNNLKQNTSLISNISFTTSSIDQYFIDAAYKNKCLHSISEVETYINTLNNHSFINKFITFKGLSTVFRRDLINRLINVNTIYSPMLAAQGTGAGRGKYVNYLANDPHANNQYLGNSVAYVPFVTNFNTTSSSLILALGKQIAEYKNILDNVYLPPKSKSKSATSSFGQNVTEHGKIITPNHTISTLVDVEPTVSLTADQQRAVDRANVAPVVRIEKRKAPAFIDETYADRNCLMRELVMTGTTGEDFKARAKNAIEFGMPIYKSLMSVYAELNEPAKYLHVDSSLDEINMLVSRNERKTPITYAVELIPNIVNTIADDGVGNLVEANILKTYDTIKIRNAKPLGIKCRNIYDLDKFFNGDKSELLRMIKPFILSDTIQPLTIKDFSWTEKIADSAGKSTLSPYIQTTAKLTKYLYEIEFKSMFGNMFPVFNNLDNPKFDIVTAPGAGNQLGVVAGQSFKCYNNDIQMGSLQTSLPGVFSHQYLTAEVNDICPYTDLVELAFARKAAVGAVAAGVSTKSVGFMESGMLPTQELISLLEIDSNSDRLNGILSVPQTRSTASKIGTSNNFNQLLAENILDIGIFPLNIHAMAKEIPMAELINNVYSYDIIMKWLLKYQRHDAKAGMFIGVGAAAGAYADTPVVVPNDAYENRSRVNQPVAAAVVNDMDAGETKHTDVVNNLFNFSTYNYCVNPLGSYIYPIGINKEHIIDANWINIHPTLNGTSKLNKLTKSRLDNSVGIYPPTGAPAAVPTQLILPKADDAVYRFEPNIGVNDPNRCYILSEDYMNIEDVGNPNRGAHLINGTINIRQRNAVAPVQYNFGFIDKPDPGCSAAENMTMQTINLNLGVHLSDAVGTIGVTEIKKSKLVRALMNGDKTDKHPRTSAAGVVNNLVNANGTDIAGAGANIANVAAGTSVLTTGDVVNYPKESYYRKQKVGNIDFRPMDLMHGVDYECQQPVLGLNIFADVLMNIYTAKLYDEIKTQRDRSSQVSIGEAAIFDQYFR